MAELVLEHIHKEIVEIKQDLSLLKNILLEEYELTDWAKKELVRARKTPINEFVDLKDVRKRLLK